MQIIVLEHLNFLAFPHCPAAAHKSFYLFCLLRRSACESVLSCSSSSLDFVGIGTGVKFSPLPKFSAAMTKHFLNHMSRLKSASPPIVSFWTTQKYLFALLFNNSSLTSEYLESFLDHKTMVKQLTVPAVLLKDVPMGCKGSVLPKLLLKNHTINFLRHELKTRQSNNTNLNLFCALVSPLHGTH